MGRGKKTRRLENPPFPIVGIGSSAGGLEALEEFLSHVPASSGLAFVIIQHLDPTHKGLMPEILQRNTGMKVRQVKDRTKVLRDCVYIIPPNKDMSILHGTLHLFAPAEPRGLRLPINFFFKSLAEDLQERSIGVILSGMGTDGTLGAKAIKEAAGVVLVQEPDTAKFNGMPRSVTNAGLADIIAPAAELPEKLLGLVQTPLLIPRTETVLESGIQGGLDKIILLLRAKTGHDFFLYKKNTLYRRIERRMRIHQIDKITLYAQFVQRYPQELDLLFKELLIGVTSFFRDPAAWERLAQQELPALLSTRPNGFQFRAWVPGCSTGEEAYSLAIVFKEAVARSTSKGNFSFQIFASDLDHDAIAKARQGLYSANIAAEVSPERLKRFFVKEDNGYRLRKEIREMVIFAPQNLIMDPPFTKLGILVCRNLLIYLTPELQKKLLPLFHFSLNPGGLLFLGSAETITGFAELFETLDPKWKIFRRRKTKALPSSANYVESFFPIIRRTSPKTSLSPAVPNLQSQADQFLLRQFSPPAVLTNDKGDILYVSGKTGKYLEPAAGKANWNIFAMAREGLRYELTNAFHSAVRRKSPIKSGILKVKTDGGTQNVEITIRLLTEPEALMGMFLIVFQDLAALPKTVAVRNSLKPAGRSARAAELERELRRAQEEQRASLDDIQTSQEELKSANEELQSINEEMQSTNEEMTTSKEEMQSLNEELQTLNSELQAKVDELSRTNNDMKNLLNSTDIATLFLDNDLKVRRFTTQMTKIVKLIPGDVGRPITDIATSLVYPEFSEDVRAVFQTLTSSEKQITAGDGRWFVTRIMPYRTLENMIDGVVVTFSDITAIKTLEAALRRARDEMESKVEKQTAALTEVQAALRAESVERSRLKREPGTTSRPIPSGKDKR